MDSKQHADPKVASRMRAFAGSRQPVYYDKPLQDVKHIHFPAGGKHRMLQHWCVVPRLLLLLLPPLLINSLLTSRYAFLFFADSAMASFYRRFVRDYMRYNDEIQCGGHTLVSAVRAEAKRRTNTSDFYALHVRRGDFQFKEVKLPASKIVANLKGNALIPRGALVYMSTDDPDGVCKGCMANRKPCPQGKEADEIKGCMSDPTWKAFRDNGWELVFLRDFEKAGVLKGVNPNFFGHLDTIVCSRAKIFAGTWFSTFTGYIHRLRGYHGLGEATYYHSPKKLEAAQSDTSVGHGFAREWRAGWADDDVRRPHHERVV